MTEGEQRPDVPAADAVRGRAFEGYEDYCALLHDCWAQVLALPQPAWCFEHLLLRAKAAPLMSARLDACGCRVELGSCKPRALALTVSAVHVGLGSCRQGLLLILLSNACAGAHRATNLCSGHQSHAQAVGTGAGP